MVETALVMPLYMLILLGLLYFGYATLHRQRAVKAAALAAWMPETQPANLLLTRLWLHASGDLLPADPTPQPTGPDTWKLGAQGDLTLAAFERSSQFDDYYGQEIPSQLTSGPLLGGGQPDTFDRERLAVSLWNYALGETTQSFAWDPVNGLTPVTQTSYDSIAWYLNSADLNAPSRGGGFVAADAANPPVIDSHIGWIASAFNGVGGVHWLERRHALVDATYSPPYFPAVFSETTEPPTTLANYIAGNYPAPATHPLWEFTMDLTGRNSGGSRLAAGEQGQTADSLLGEIGDLFNSPSLPAVNDTTSNLWRSW